MLAEVHELKGVESRRYCGVAYSRTSSRMAGFIGVYGPTPHDVWAQLTKFLGEPPTPADARTRALVLV